MSLLYAFVILFVATVFGSKIERDSPIELSSSQEFFDERSNGDSLEAGEKRNMFKDTYHGDSHTILSSNTGYSPMEKINGVPDEVLRDTPVDILCEDEEHDAIKQQILALKKEESAALQAEIKVLKGDYDILRKQNDLFKQELVKVKNSSEISMKKEHEALQKQNDLLKKELNSLKTQNIVLKKEVIEMENESEVLRKLEHTFLQQQLNVLKEELATMANRSETLRVELADLSSFVDKHRCQIAKIIADKISLGKSPNEDQSETVMCGSKILGFRIRSAAYLRGIQLKCSGGEETRQIIDLSGAGDWKEWKTCKYQGYIKGFNYKRDNLGISYTNGRNIKMVCNDNEELYSQHTNRGSWEGTGHKECSSEQFLCGLRVWKIDTLRKIEFICCYGKHA